MKTRISRMAALTALVLTLLVLTVVVGCKKNNGDEKAQAGEIQQQYCPVMGNPINTQYFTTFQGKKVYFCCPECIGTFEENPEKYIDKLPQFEEQGESMMKEAESMKEEAEKTTEKASEEMEDAMENMTQ